MRARVLSVDSASRHVQLSTRPSDGGVITGLPAAAALPAHMLEGLDSEAAPASLKCSQLKLNQQVRERVTVAPSLLVIMVALLAVYLGPLPSLMTHASGHILSALLRTAPHC